MKHPVKNPTLRLALSTTLLCASLFAASTTFGQEVLGEGSFKGLSSHQTTGSVSIVKEGDTHVIKLGEDFSFDGAPDPKVALGKDGEYDPATLIELLRSNTGAQTYEVPASVDIGEYNEVYIWCEKFSVGLGVAALN